MPSVETLQRTLLGPVIETLAGLIAPVGRRPAVETLREIVDTAGDARPGHSQD